MGKPLSAERKNGRIGMESGTETTVTRFGICIFL